MSGTPRPWLRMARWAQSSSWICFLLASCSSDELLQALISPPDAEAPPFEAVSPPPDTSIRIKEIQVQAEVQGEPGEGLLEIEVHIVDAGSGALLGRAGAIQGLWPVDISGVVYRVDAYFVKPGSVTGYPAPRANWISEDDVKGKSIKLMIIEDDHSPGASPGEGSLDDLVGVSRALNVMELHTPMTLTITADGRNSKLVVVTP